MERRTCPPPIVVWRRYTHANNLVEVVRTRLWTDGLLVDMFHLKIVKGCIFVHFKHILDPRKRWPYRPSSSSSSSSAFSAQCPWVSTAYCTTSTHLSLSCSVNVCKSLLHNFVTSSAHLLRDPPRLVVPFMTPHKRQMFTGKATTALWGKPNIWYSEARAGLSIVPVVPWKGAQSVGNFCKHFTTALEGLARSSSFRPKMHQMLFGRPGSARSPGPAALPQTSSCIETPRVFGARSRLTPSALGNRAFRFFFFPFEHWKGPPPYIGMGPPEWLIRPWVKQNKYSSEEVCSPALHVPSTWNSLPDSLNDTSLSLFSSQKH